MPAEDPRVDLARFSAASMASASATLLELYGATYRTFRIGLFADLE